MPEQKQRENVKYFRYVDSVIINGTSSTREIKSRIAMALQPSTRGRVFSPSAVA